MTGVAACAMLLLGVLIGFAWGSEAGDPTRQVTGVVDNFNDHAIGLIGVKGEEDGMIGAAFARDPELEIHRGDTVRGTLVEFDEPGRINTFIVEEVVSPRS